MSYNSKLNRNRPCRATHGQDHGVDPYYFNTIQGNDIAEPFSPLQSIPSQSDLDAQPSNLLAITESVDAVESIPTSRGETQDSQVAAEGTIRATADRNARNPS
ncbi:hypothetical protein BGZ80_002524 [Entomortierella chlamydospora]|uniref:Uncharacterized protein n=1 Tax=Entomortierella chlamydospora TaxID=101097 RepID=A0A9P6MPB9_9FUNG|nr:hypothetical protein BGZ80_002524 [Entomortierella chlamydospora]